MGPRNQQRPVGSKQSHPHPNSEHCLGQGGGLTKKWPEGHCDVSHGLSCLISHELALQDCSQVLRDAGACGTGSTGVNNAVRWCHCP